MMYIYAELLYHQWFIYYQVRDKNILDQKGQTLVEFILLLSVLMLTSLIFLSTVNTGTGTLWLNVVKALIEDPNVTISLR